MLVKFTKKDQLQIIEHLRFGRDWPIIKSNLLPFQYSFSGTWQSDTANNVIVYTIKGDSEKVTTSDSKIQQKVKQILQSSSSSSITEFSNNRKSAHLNSNEQFFQPEERYYSNQIKCKICNSYGHKPEMCYIPRKCNYCLCLAHQADKCNHKNICTNCYQLGHNIENCIIKQRMDFCPTCERDHVKYTSGKNCYSLTRGRDQKKSLFPTDSFYSYSQILCMKCRNYGHLICF